MRTLSWGSYTGWMKNKPSDDILPLMNYFIEKLFKRGILAMFLLLPLAYIPWWVSPYVTAKVFFLMALVDLLAMVWVWLLIIDARYRPTKKQLIFLLPVLVFLVVLTISAICGVDRATSFLSTVESGTGLVMMYHAFLFMCMVASGMRVLGSELWRKIRLMIFASGVFLAVTTFFTDITLNIGLPVLNNSQGGAMMGNVLFLGAYLIFAFFLGATLLFSEPERVKKMRYILGLVIILLSPAFFIDQDIWKGLIPFSKIFSSPVHILGGARMASISLGIGILVAGCTWLLLSSASKIRRVLGGVGLAVLLLGIGFGIHQAFVPGSSTNTYFVHESGNRLIDWHEAVQGIKEKPVLGWGPENYRVVFQKHLDPHVFDPGQGNEVWTLHPHNQLLEVLINGGVIGLLVYMGILAALGCMIRLLYRRKIIEAKTCALLVGMLVAYVLQNQMAFDTVVSLAIFFGLFGMVVGLLYQSGESQDRRITISEGGYWIGGAVNTVLFALLIVMVFIPMSKVGGLYRLAHDTSEGRSSRYQKVFNGPGSATIQTGIPVFLDSFIRSYDSQKQSLLSNPNQRELVSKELETLLVALDPVWEKRTMDYHLSLSLVQLQNLALIFKEQPSADDLTRVKKYAERAFALSPTDPQVYVTTAQTFVYLGDIENAKKMVEKALVLNSNYTIAQKLKVLLDQ